MSPLRVLVLQGPNLSLLGTRETAIYGAVTLSQIQAELDRQAAPLGLALVHRQSNHEGGLVDAVHQAAADGFAGAIINAAAYTHTSIALRDALLATKLRFIEVHISNVYAREPFRHHSHLADIAAGVIVGFGPDGYALALRGLARILGRDAA